MDYINNLEQWRMISGFPNYMISSCGRVMNIRTFKVLRPGINSSGYLHVCLSKDANQSFKTIHRIVANAFILNLTDLPCVDHIDRNKLNNHLSNLRWCTREENQHNRSKQKKDTTSVYKGVYFDKKANKWRAQIKHNGQQIHIGYFLDESEAGRAYDRKANELFREFANLNF